MLSLNETDFLFGSYILDRDTTIKIAENATLLPTSTDISASLDNINHVFIGYGYDLYVNDPFQFAEDVNAISNKLGVSVSVSLNDINLLLNYQEGFENKWCQRPIVSNIRRKKS